MNKFVLVPKEQFENLRENHMTESGSDSDKKTSQEGEKSIKNQETSTEGENIIERANPPPGLPNHYPGVGKIKKKKKEKKISDYGRDTAVRKSSGGRHGKSEPEWFRFWNKNIK